MSASHAEIKHKNLSFFLFHLKVCHAKTEQLKQFLAQKKELFISQYKLTFAVILMSFHF